MSVPVTELLRSSSRATKDLDIHTPQLGSRKPASFYRDNAPTNIREFEEKTLKGKPLFTRQYIDAAAKHRDEGEGGCMLDWQRSYALSKYPEKYSTEQIPLMKDPVRKEIGSTEDIQEMVRQVQQRWDASKICAQLKRLLHETADKVSQIEKIICFGLGSISSVSEWFPGYSSQFSGSEIDRWQRGNVLQHLAAMTVASTLNKIYNKGKEKPSIRILAQDPGYSDIDQSVLSSLEIPIQTIDDPDGFLAIDENTFVVTCLCAAPVYEIMADLVASSHCGRGPAAFIADKLTLAEPIEYVCASNRETPRVMRFLRNYERRSFDDCVGPTEQSKEEEGVEMKEYSWWKKLEMHFRSDGA